MKQTKLWAVMLMVVCTLFTSAAQLLLKLGSEDLSLNIFSLVTNWPLMLGLVSYSMGAVLLIVALRGGEVTILYPIVASSYIWVALGSNLFFGEVINGMRWSGLGLVMLGIIFINMGGKHEH